jgi:DNA primase
MRIKPEDFKDLLDMKLSDIIAKIENKSEAAVVSTGGQTSLQGPPSENDTVMELLQKDALQEKAFVRCLLEFGLKPWNDTQTVADYIFHEGIDVDIIDDPMLQSVIRIYQQWYQEGLEPGPRSFLYHEDGELNKAVISIMEVNYEMSPNWKDRLGRAPITREESYREEVHSVLTYLKLRKIKRMMDENQSDMEKPHSAEELATLIKTHQHLKTLEKELTSALGTVIFR